MENEITGVTATLDANTSVYSSQDKDLAPSKTALFGLSVIFHTVSNPTLRHLLLTALLHPFSPPSSGGTVIQAAPQVTIPRGKEQVQQEGNHKDIQIEVRIEDNHFQPSHREGNQRHVRVYCFGTSECSEMHSEDTVGGGSNVCIFILAPALVEMLSSSGEPQRNDEKRPNPYRRILLSFVSGCDEMACLQSLAISALHAAVSSVDGWTIQQIMLPNDGDNDECATKVKADVAIIKNTFESLCRSIVNTTVTYDGWWKARFNCIAARTLMDLVSNNCDFLSLVSKLMGQIRKESAQFLISLPSRLDAKSKEASESPNKSNSKANAVDKTYLETWLLDRFYFDQADKSTVSVVERVCYLKEENGDEESKSQCRYGLEVLASDSIAQASTLLCDDMRLIESMLVSEAKGDTPIHCAASWALTCLSLDAFCRSCRSSNRMLNLRLETR